MTDKYILSWFQFITLEVERPKLMAFLFGRKTISRWVLHRIRISGIDADNFVFEGLAHGAYDMVQLEKEN